MSTSEDLTSAIVSAHFTAADLGYTRTRLDRSEHHCGAWMEVGAGCGEVLARFSSGARVTWSPGRPTFEWTQSLYDALIAQIDRE